MGTRTFLRRAADRIARIDPEIAGYRAIRGHLRDVVPADVTSLDAEAFVPDAIRFGSGVDLRDAAQLQLLEQWESQDFSSLFSAIRADPDINTMQRGQSYLHNGQFPTPDAEVYSTMIATEKPARIIEIGAGFSTRVARRTITELGMKTEILVIDPEPRADVAGVADRVIRQRVELVPDQTLTADSETLLFIDSSHVLKSGGDLPFLFCQVLPALPEGVLVHVHDVFLPYDYPPAYRRRLYTEQYLLWALLTNGARYETLFANHWMVRAHQTEMQRVFGPQVGADIRYCGASYWFRVSVSPV